LQAHPACNHSIWSLIHASGSRSTTLRAFAMEYGILRKAVRPLDAGCPDSERLFGDFLSSCGEHDRIEGFGHALPGTRLAAEGLLELLADSKTRFGAIWAIEGVARYWAENWCASRQADETVWDGYFHALAQADTLAPAPNTGANQEPWQNGFQATLDRLALIMDGLQVAFDLNISHAV